MDGVPVNLSHVTWAVLAGGKGMRMGQPKARLRVSDEPILTWLVRQMRWPGPTLLVTAPGETNPPGTDAFDREAVDAEAVGPLGGVCTALQAAETDIVLVTTVDSPAWTAGRLAYLVDHLAGLPAAIGVMLRRVRNEEVGIEPFPCAVRRLALPVVLDRLAGARRSTAVLGETGVFDVIDTPADWPAEVWANLNTPADFAAFIASSIPPPETSR